MGAFLIRFLYVIILLFLGVVIGKVYWIHHSVTLKPWHTYIPDELSDSELENSDWVDYINNENKIFIDINKNVSAKVKNQDEDSFNRYDRESPIYPGNFFTDWNRSYIMQPRSNIKGAVVLLHGLTDSPYSLRHIAKSYKQAGFVAIGIRLPAHGTVPGALTHIKWQNWLSATKLAVREATKLAGENTPLHIVGFSNGGALALKYTLDALDDENIRMPQQLVLLSPMVGITRLAHFTRWSAILPAFSRAAWLDIMPEFNPFKYNSFPINGARQAHLLTLKLQQQIANKRNTNEWVNFPPVLTFQSVIDSTVSTKAVVDTLYQNLPDNGSEVVLFDINRAISFRFLFNRASEKAISRILPKTPQKYTTTVIRNTNTTTLKISENITPANTTIHQTNNLDLEYPANVFSLSHVALPFPLTDPLYGATPTHPETYGVNFGVINFRGERSVLQTNFDSFMRVSSNPFFSYLNEKINKAIQ